ncbi:hypothetical protein MMB19_26495 [Ralstonia insidiosa]|nr:hypothetical protein MMB19_26495 [Ralstonia insidiosa]
MEPIRTKNRSGHVCLIAISILCAPLLPAYAAAQAPTTQESATMLPLAQMIQKRDWDAAQAYVDRQSIGIIPEIRVIVNDPKTDSTTRDIAYGYLRRVRTLDSALLLAQGLGEGGEVTACWA